MACALRAARLPAPWHLADCTAHRARPVVDGPYCAAPPSCRVLVDWTGTSPPIGRRTAWLRQMGQTPRLIERALAPADAGGAQHAARRRLGAGARDRTARQPGGGTRARRTCGCRAPTCRRRCQMPSNAIVIAHGGDVRRNHRVDLARGSERGWSLAIRSGGDHTSLDVDAVVYAAPPSQLQRVFGLHADALRGQLRMIERFRYEPITTVYLKYEPDEPRLPPLFHALVEDPARRHHGQWVFNRGVARRRQPAACSRSSSAPAASTRNRHSMRCATQLPARRAMSMGCHRRAPHAPSSSGAQRWPACRISSVLRTSTGLTRLALAGDWTASEYPCTLETAVRSGLAAARSVGAAPAA